MKSHYLTAPYLLGPFYHTIKNGSQKCMHCIFDLAPDQFNQASYFNEYYRATTLGAVYLCLYFVQRCILL